MTESDREGLWGQEYFVGPDAEPALNARIRAAIDGLCTSRWLMLHPASGAMRLRVEATGDTARKALWASDEFQAQRRAPTPPCLLVRLLEAPRNPYAIRRDRSARHPVVRVVPGGQLRLVLEDWLHRAEIPGPVPSPGSFFPLFVIAADDDPAAAWRVEVGHIMIFEDGMTWRLQGVEVGPDRIEPVDAGLEPLYDLGELDR